MKRIRCPHCDTPFDVVALSGLWPQTSMKAVDKHIAKCATMSEKDRAYYYKNRYWPRKSGKKKTAR